MPWKVLLVDDDEVLVEAVRVVLETKYEIHTAANGKQALEAIERVKPDVAVLDVMMDHLSEGFDLAKKLKADPATQEIKVIMLTGVDEVYNIRMEIEDEYTPYDLFLEKPVSPGDLLRAIDGLLEGREA